MKKLKLCIKELISKKFLISQKSGEVILSEKALEMVESGNGLNGFRLWARAKKKKPSAKQCALKV